MMLITVGMIRREVGCVTMLSADNLQVRGQRVNLSHEMVPIYFRVVGF